MKSKLHHVQLTACNMFDWSERDGQALNSWLTAYANLLGHNQEGKAIALVRNALAMENIFPTGNINRWFYAVLSLIFYELLTLLRQCEGAGWIDTGLKKLERRFVPSIDFADSYFNNCFDQIDFMQDRGSIIAQAIKLLDT